jgi:hypothetical protein
MFEWRNLSKPVIIRQEGFRGNVHREKKGIRGKYWHLVVVGERNRRGKHHAITHSYLPVFGHSFISPSLQGRAPLFLERVRAFL